MFKRTEIEISIVQELAKLRESHEHEAKLRLQHARKNKEFDDLYKIKKELEFSIAEADFKKEDSTSLKTKYTKIKTKLRQLIKKLGMNEHDFAPKFNCTICNDTGYVGGEKCQCLKSMINEKLVELSGLEKTKLNTFDDYNEQLSANSVHQKMLSKLKTTLLTYVENFAKSPHCNVLLSGPVGVGKTFALECTTSEILKKGHTANFLTAFQLNNQFLKYHTCFDANKQSYLNLLLEPDLLVIDDLGTEPMLNNVTNEYLYLVLSERMLKHKHTLISTNLSLSQILERYNERIFSRLTDKTKSILLRIDGDDLRSLKRS